jgi:hypothetical protein
MTTQPEHLDASVIRVHVPFAIRKRGGRKVIVIPDGQQHSPACATRASPPLLKALARAFRWRRLLETGAYATIDEIARAEKANPSYVSRVIRLTLLAPDIVEGILDARCTPHLQELLKAFPVVWDKQRSLIRSTLDGA